MHLHHILPKHAGGTNDLSNLIKLSIKDHANAHRILFEKFGKFQDRLAWQGLSRMISKEDLIHQLLSEAGKHWIGKKLPLEHKKHISESITGKKNPFYGKHHNNKTKNQISVSVRKIMNDPIFKASFIAILNTHEIKEKKRKSQIGHFVSQETKDKIREKAIGRKASDHTKEERRKSALRFRWIKNIILKESKRILKIEEIPEGWIPGRILKSHTQQTRELMSKSAKKLWEQRKERK